MLQRKREQFKIQIRKTQIQKFKQIRRKQFFNYDKHINEQQINRLQFILTKITDLLHDDQQIDQINKLNCVKECFQNIFNISQQIARLITYQINKQQFSEKYVFTVMKDLIKNQIQNQYENQDQEIQINNLKKYSTQVRQYTIYQMLKVLEKIEFLVLGKNMTQKVVQIMFILIRQSGLLYLQKVNFNTQIQSDYPFLYLTLNILIKIFQQLQLQTYNYFLCQGIGPQLVNIISHIKCLKLDISIHSKLLHLLSQLLSSQQKHSSSLSQNSPGGITITTQSTIQKQTFLCYCLSFIDKKQQCLFSLSLTCIKQLIQINDFLTGELSDQSLLLVGKLIVHKDRNIQNSALKLLHQFIYYSENNVIVLLGKNAEVLDLLYERLMIEKNVISNSMNMMNMMNSNMMNNHMNNMNMMNNNMMMNTNNNNKITSQQTKSNILTISYILCNICLTQRPFLKKLILSHHIWQQIYLNLHPSSALFPLICSMQYLFHLIHHQDILKFLIPFLQSLTSFQYKLTEYYQIIRRILMRLFQKSQYWKYNQYEKFIKVMEQYGFMYLIEDKIDEKDVENMI